MPNPSPQAHQRHHEHRATPRRGPGRQMEQDSHSGLLRFVHDIRAVFVAT
jgi:hypothetical protein